MKLYVAVLMMTLGITCALVINDNGQPGCKTDEEIKIQNYRNIWDPTAYWRCDVKGQNAVKVKCEDGLAWLDSQKKCVDWIDWDWEEPQHPPSRAV